MHRVHGLLLGLLPALAIAVVAAPAARAEKAPSQPGVSAKAERKNEAIESCLDKIGLNAKQKADIDSLNSDTATKRQAILQSNKSKREKKSELRKLDKEHKAAMDKILTKDQQKALRECVKHSRSEKDRSEREEHHSKRAKSAPGAK
ncbi:MAG: hypothetical protein IT209_03380 [Armatimonadetes bacterium]|nr:hypothetical protein [Armatimonadota bacterium]